MVVDVLVPEPVGEVAVVVVVAAVVVELPEEGAVVVAEPSPGAEAGAGAEVVPDRGGGTAGAGSARRAYRSGVCRGGWRRV